MSRHPPDLSFLRRDGTMHIHAGGKRPPVLPDDDVYFVFGSNLAGRHGQGAAKFAKEHKGAKYSAGLGFTGRAYALPTKDAALRTLPLHRIQEEVVRFLERVAEHPERTFFLTRVGCGLAGYENADIAPMFEGAKSLKNIVWPIGWSPWMGDDVAYHGEDYEEWRLSRRGE